MRVGCLNGFSHSSQTASQSIFFISISFLSYEGSLMFHAFRYPWRMPCGCPCHVKVLNFTVALMSFLSGLWSAPGGNRLQRHANTKNYRPKTLFKVYETLWVALGQLVPWPHSISGLFHWKKADDFPFFSFFFPLYRYLAFSPCSGRKK